MSLEMKPPGATPEHLVHNPGDIVIGLTVSPKGKECIGMTVGDKKWVLLTTKRAPLTTQIMDQLKNTQGADTLPGIPFNWRESLKEKKLTWLMEPGAIGVYVPEEQFDDLIGKLSGL